MKLFFFFLLVCLSGITMGQTKDSIGTNGTKGSINPSDYKYYRPGVYLEKAGRLGTGKYIVALSGTILGLWVSQNPDAGNTPAVIFGAASIVYVIMDFSAWNNVKKAGLATEERRSKVTLGVAPTGVKLCYTF